MKSFITYFKENLDVRAASVRDLEPVFLPKIKHLQNDYAKCKEIVYIIADTALKNGVSDFEVKYGTVTPLNPYDNEKGDPIEHYWIIEKDNMVDYADKQFDDEEGELEYMAEETYSPTEFLETEFERSHKGESI